MASTADMKVPSPNAGRPAASLFDRARLAGQGSDLLDQIQSGLRRRSRRRKAVAKAATATALVIAGLFWAVPYVRETSTVATLPAHRQQLALSDGSQAELNARTSLHTDFRYGRRIVRLESGEAFFSVAKDPAHPFLVETPLGVVRVTGTQFNVRLAPGGTAAVTLFEGVVNIAPTAGAPVRLHPGEQADLGSGSAAVHALTPAALENAIAWRQGRIVLDGLTVTEAAARLAEFHGLVITVSPAVANVRLGGSFPLDNLDQFFAALKSMSGLQVVARGDGSFLITGRQ